MRDEDTPITDALKFAPNEANLIDRGCLRTVTATDSMRMERVLHALAKALQTAEEALHVASLNYAGRRDAYDKSQVGWMTNAAMVIRMDEGREPAATALADYAKLQPEPAPTP